MRNKLYKITNKLGEWWVVAEHPTQAEDKLIKRLTDSKYGFTSDRLTSKIEVIAIESNDNRFISGYYLIT